MRGPLFQLIASGVVLGMMGGAAVIHALHVAGARELGEPSGWEESDRPAAAGVTSFVTPASVLAPPSRRAGTVPAAEPATTTTILALEEIVERLQELKARNDDLLEQQKATNEDVLEIQFRQNMLDDKFIPLRSAPRSSDGHMVLPPKSW